jgi:glycosyltransferase involved in cell wall biosynthesis
MAMLCQGGAGTFRVAYFYEEHNNSTFRYRAYNMVQVLNDLGSKGTAASYFFMKDLARMDDIADMADLLVVCRSRYEMNLSQLVTKFKARGRPVLFDVDDLVFDPSCVHLIMNTLAQDTAKEALWDYWFAYTSRMEQALRLCDGAITTNDYLAQRISETTNLPSAVVPNFMNQEQEDISKRLFDNKKANEFAREGPMTLGYFSGSPSHQLDFAIVEEALLALMTKYEDLHLMVVGYIETGDLLARFANRIEYVPFQDYVNLQRYIARVDFNLMPLQSNAFTNCKSELKYFEAAAVGTLSIASPTYTYAKAIKDKVNGRLAKAHEWATIIEQAILDRESYSGMALQASIDVQSKFTWHTQRQTILNAFAMLD